MRKTKKLVLLSLLVAIAMILSYVENMIPIGFSYLGAKLGLANVISLIALYVFGFKEAITIVLIRTLLVDTLFGSMTRFMFSISGGILSVVAMYIIYKILKDKVSVIGVSVVGAVFHSIGQIVVAAFIVQNAKIAVLLPYLVILSTVTGVFVGIAAKFMLKRLEEINMS